eukprot:9846820-Ditylum_brightwellii.AAC.1
MSKLHEVDGYTNGEHPFALAAKANAMDILNYWQAMNRPDADLLVEAIQEEMDALGRLKAWELIDIEDVPLTADDGGVKKRKARLCTRGDQQFKNIDYFETYAPANLCPGEEVYMSLPCGYRHLGK